MDQCIEEPSKYVKFSQAGILPMCFGRLDVYSLFFFVQLKNAISNVPIVSCKEKLDKSYCIRFKTHQVFAKGSDRKGESSL